MSPIKDRIALPKEHHDLPEAHSLGDAVNSENTLQGYAAMNAVPPDSEIAREAASEKPVDQQEIARLAYQYWEERGREHGSHEDDWHKAEKKLRRR